MRDKAKEKEIIAAATEGPWVSKKYGGYHNIYKGPVKKTGCGLHHGGEICEMADPDCNDLTRKESAANAQFIAAARTGWPEDLVWRGRAEALLTKIQFCCGQIYGVCPTCGRQRDQKHAKDCELAALLGRGKIEQAD